MLSPCNNFLYLFIKYNHNSHSGKCFFTAESTNSKRFRDPFPEYRLQSAVKYIFERWVASGSAAAARAVFARWLYSRLLADIVRDAAWP